MTTDISPDDKDWTWVLRERCPECGYNASEVDPLTVGTAVRDLVPLWRSVLARHDATVRRDPSMWSDLEYGCHVRDVFRIFDERLDRMLTEDGPRFANWDQDATAIADRYAEQDPDTVADELAQAGSAIADRLDTVRAEHLARTGLRSDGAEFTIATFGQYFLHDPLHHLRDVGAA